MFHSTELDGNLTSKECEDYFKWFEIWCLIKKPSELWKDDEVVLIFHSEGSLCFTENLCHFEHPQSSSNMILKEFFQLSLFVILGL